jgi:hypothetical protein
VCLVRGEGVAESGLRLRKPQATLSALSPTLADTPPSFDESRVGAEILVAFRILTGQWKMVHWLFNYWDAKTSLVVF